MTKIQQEALKLREYTTEQLETINQFLEDCKVLKKTGKINNPNYNPESINQRAKREGITPQALWERERRKKKIAST